MRFPGLARQVLRSPVAVAEPRVSSEARTHVGRVRMVNEDRVFDRPDRGLWAVADGMGGHGGGDIAAALAVAALDALAAGAAPIGGDAVADAIEAGNRAILDQNRRQRGSSGATIVVLHHDGASAEIFWAGDSRAYRIRAGRAEQLTHDHSVVQELVDAGLIALEDAEGHPRAHVVTRALGVDANPGIARRVVDIEPGDLFLLCSDGFSRRLTTGALAAEIARAGDSASALLTRAVERDGSDNISFVMVRIAP